MSIDKSFDPELLHTLVVIAEERNLTGAAKRLHLTQQAVSAQLRRCEAMVNRPLFNRSPGQLELTPDGEILLLFAKQMADLSSRVRRHFAAIELDGTIRAGFVEGFASTGLPLVLGQLRRTQPKLEIFVQTGRTDGLLEQFAAGRLDLVLGVQRDGGQRGEVLRRDKLSWVGDVSALADPGVPVPLALLPAPNLLRTIVLEKLAAAGRSWTVLFESDDLASVRAAVYAGWGVSAFGYHLGRHENFEMPPDDLNPLPDLGRIEIFLQVAAGAGELVTAFADLIRPVTRDVLWDAVSTGI